MVSVDTLFPDLEGAARQANMEAPLTLWGALLRLTERRDFPPRRLDDGSDAQIVQPAQEGTVIDQTERDD